MIAWMQKHNKYLVITIWIATIAFIGAGFVGWGTYQYGKKATAIAEVGDVSISQDKFDFTYRNMYRKYNEIFQGQFDDEKAKEMKLPQMVFSQLVSQALLLNLANEYGLRVSDEELAKYISSLQFFKNSGSFDKQIYQTFLENNGISAKNFEGILKDDLRIEKLMRLLDKPSVKYEREVIASALSVEDKISYVILSSSDIEIKTDADDIKKFWESHKKDYMTKKKYKLSILWTNLDEIAVDEKELKDFYHRNSYNYIGSDGKELSLENARKDVVRDYKLKRGKKKALKEYIAFKKGKKEASETVKLNINDPKLSKEMWSEIIQSDRGSIIKPKAVGERYATVKVDDTIEPREMSFDEAKDKVTEDYTKTAAAKALDKVATEYIDGKKKLNKTTEFLSASKPATLEGLTKKESLQFFKKLFTSNKHVGMITLSNKRIVYRVSEQRIGKTQNERVEELTSITNKIKSSDLSDNLMKELSEKYKIQKFVKGI